MLVHSGAWGANRQREERRDAAWSRLGLSAASGANVTVALIDSGWTRGIHEPRVRAGIGIEVGGTPTSLKETSDTTDRNGHGTACGVMLLALAPNVAITPIRVLSEALRTSPLVLCRALEIAREARVDLVALSLSTVLSCAVAPLHKVCAKLASAGSIIIAAGEFPYRGSMPAGFDCVLGVAAGAYKSPADFASLSSGPIEYVARGFGLAPVQLGPRHYELRGASAAVPHMCAIVAKLRERHGIQDMHEARRMLGDLALIRI